MGCAVESCKTRIDHPFGNIFCNLFMVIWGMVFMIVLTTLNTFLNHSKPNKLHPALPSHPSDLDLLGKRLASLRSHPEARV